ncbi:hypothetical protein [Streptomyces decoyicus]|uniref:hypothetical protein n=1 Tax=Streptomyces decoyicus TaxID=249567 RepID=UPI0036555827
MTTEEPDTTTIQPAVAWPSYELDHARAEVVALRMLVEGATLSRVRQRTRLGWEHIYRLADVVREEARTPAAPRNVLRDRRPRRPARIRVVEPRQEELPQPTGTEDAPDNQDAMHGPREPDTPVAARAEPEQLALICV